MFLGTTAGKPCHTGKSSPNSSISITGISGSGKTCRMNQIELDEVKQGNTVLVIDYGRTHSNQAIFTEIRQEYMEFLNYVDASADALGIRLFSPLKNSDGRTESFVSLVNSAVQGLGSSINLGGRQEAALREAVIEAISCLEDAKDKNEAEVLLTVFEGHQDTARTMVYQKLWTVLNCNILRSCTRPVLRSKINILDLSGVDMVSRLVLAELILSQIWRRACFLGQACTSGDLTIVLDEYQHLSMKKGSVLRYMLTEGRKYKLNLILGTQTLDIFPTDVISILNQSATRLYFHPSVNEMPKIARQIDPAKMPYWREKLGKLRVGECIATGEKDVCGHNISRPLILS